LRPEKSGQSFPEKKIALQKGKKAEEKKALAGATAVIPNTPRGGKKKKKPGGRPKKKKKGAEREKNPGKERRRDHDKKKKREKGSNPEGGKRMRLP